MSEIRRVAVKMTNINQVQEACKAAGLEFVKQGERILVRNHGMHIWGSGEVVLLLQKDGTYVLEADANEKDLENLASKIKSSYAETIVIKETAKHGYNVTNRQVDQQKKKVRLRLVAWV